MTAAFDASIIERHGWRQGAVLGPELIVKARNVKPKRIGFSESDWLIVTSHDCDVVNKQLEKEPEVEVLRASVSQSKKLDRQQVWGRNPREMQVEVDDGSNGVIALSLKVHERWLIPREYLVEQAPRLVLDNKTRRLIAEWLAKRFIRAAFPSSFDGRWRMRMKDWVGLLQDQSQWVQGIYLRLSTLAELPTDRPYGVHLIVAVPATVAKAPEWARKKPELESLVSSFWEQSEPGIECAGVDAIATDKLTLADIEPYQRFDADWISFDDDSPATPSTVDMHS